MSPSVDQPIGPKDGLSSRHERRWGLIGGTLGSLVGGGAAVVGVFIDDLPWYTSGPYPRAFTEGRLLALDVYLLVVLIVGVGFSTTGMVLARRSPYPRTDAFGAGLLATILMGLSGLILFIRLVALIRAG